MKVEKILFLVERELDPTSLERVRGVARIYGATVTVAAVIPPARAHVLLSRPGFDLDEMERLLAEDRRRELEAVVESVGPSEVETDTVVLVGKPVQSIVGYVEEHQIDYLFNCNFTVGHGGDDFLLSRFDSFGDFHLALSGQEGDGAHFTEIHSYRIIDGYRVRLGRRGLVPP